MNNKPTIIDAILSLKDDAKVILKDEDYNSIIWEDGNPTGITKTQIETKLSELTTDYNSQDYARKRQEEYPPMEDYLDGIVKDDQAQIDKYIADCKAVKDKYAKS